MIYGREPTPEELKAAGENFRNCESGITEKEFTQALAPIQQSIGGLMHGGGSHRAYRASLGIGKNWSLLEVFNHAEAPAKLVEATLYSKAPLTDEQIRKIADFVKKHPTVGSLKEFWDLFGPVLDGIIYHTAALPAGDFYATGYNVGDHYIGLLHDRKPWIDLSFR